MRHAQPHTAILIPYATPLPTTYPSLPIMTCALRSHHSVGVDHEPRCSRTRARAVLSRALRSHLYT